MDDGMEQTTDWLMMTSPGKNLFRVQLRGRICLPSLRKGILQGCDRVGFSPAFRQNIFQAFMTQPSQPESMFGRGSCIIG
ncbi:hypothetical protein A0U92_00685 [Acetobacter aceti]|uniref:Uncharacterized protein n=1 Tax=Acetobacter aceti TaxID=435 RepID=A0A1U9KCM7_ACEAC|nr:hypothetical protein A0U92_00685 [Acetobacter aceti]